MKNILSLILRSIFIIIISLYTTRVLYNEIGEVDYGIFGLILGLTVVINIFTNSMNNSFQRFFNLNYSSQIDTEKIFLNSTFISFALGVMISLILLMIDMLFIEKLNIPVDRMFAAKMFSYYCILNVFFSIIKIPFMSLLSSKQEINKIVILSLVESSLKLIFTLSLLYIDYDNLIIYGLFLSIITLITLIINYFFIRKYITLNINLFDKSLTYNIMKFSLTNSIGNFTPIINNQILSVEINHISSVEGSSTNTLAAQINASFVSIMGMMHIVYAPIITKQYVENDIIECNRNIYKFTKYLFLISILIIVPIIVFIDFIFSVWLGNVPKMVQTYVCFYLLISLIEVISAPLWIIANAEGNIFRYQIIMLLLGILFIPLSIFILLIKSGIFYILLSLLLINITIFFYRVIYTCNILKMRFRSYMSNCINKPTILLIFLIIFGIYVNDYLFFDNDYLNFLVKAMILQIISISLMFVYLLDSVEKTNLKKIFVKKIRDLL